jgi:hypothetical protein
MPLSAQQAFEQVREEGDWIIGWKLDEEQRKELLLQFPPRYPDVVADHVTLASRVAEGSEAPSETTAEIVGRGDDGEGVEALVVRIEGTSDRPGGGTYHITWSLDKARERRAKESNDVIARLGWQEFELPMPVLLQPSCWPRESPKS